MEEQVSMPIISSTSKSAKKKSAASAYEDPHVLVDHHTAFQTPETNQKEQAYLSKWQKSSSELTSQAVSEAPSVPGAAPIGKTNNNYHFLFE